MEDEVLRQMKEQGLYNEDEEIDVDTETTANLLESLTSEAIQATNLFKSLPDIFISGMAGALWIGKDFASLEYIMRLQEIFRNQKRVFELLQVCIEEYAKYFNSQIGKGQQ